MKCYFFLPLFCFWLNVGLNHSHFFPAVMIWEWSQDMVLTLEVPAGTPSHLVLSPRHLIVTSVLVPNSSDHFKRTEDVKHIHLWGAPVCLTQTAPSSERSASLEVRIPATLRSAFVLPERGLFFWNPYFSLNLIPITDVPPCAMCRTRGNPCSKSKGQLARTQKKQIGYPCSFSEGSSCEPVFVGSRSLAILNSGSGSGRERQSLREKGVSIKDTCKPLHTQGEKGL